MDPRNGLNDRKGKKQKSTFWAYVLWLFGGLVGAHHLYLERDAHAFVYFSTFGGVGGIGWLRDIYRIPSYVADANEDARFIDDFKHKIRVNHKVHTSTKYTCELAARIARCFKLLGTKITRITLVVVEQRNTITSFAAGLTKKKSEHNVTCIRRFSRRSRRCDSLLKTQSRICGPNCTVVPFHRTKSAALIFGTY